VQPESPELLVGGAASLMSEQMIGRLVPPIRAAFPHVVKQEEAPQKSREKSHFFNNGQSLSISNGTLFYKACTVPARTKII
jgi:hypothetical protein